MKRRNVIPVLEDVGFGFLSLGEIKFNESLLPKLVGDDVIEKDVVGGDHYPQIFVGS